MSIIMDNARLGTIRQREIADDLAEQGFIDLAIQHLYAAFLLEGICNSFIPCLPEEL